MQLPQVLSLSVSPRFAVLLLVAHGGALTAVLFAGGDIRVVVVVAMAIFISALNQWRKLWGSKRVSRLILHADGSLELMRDKGLAEAASVHPHSTVTSLLVVLLLETARGLETLVVLPDTLGPEDFRMLRLWLRWRAQQGPLSPLSGA